MEKRLQRLETFAARGGDGQLYSVHGFEHQCRIDTLMTAQEVWESTGQAEYKLADGRRVQVDRDGTMTVAATGVKLVRENMH